METSSFYSALFGCLYQNQRDFNHRPQVNVDVPTVMVCEYLHLPLQSQLYHYGRFNFGKPDKTNDLLLCKILESFLYFAGKMGNSCSDLLNFMSKHTWNYNMRQKLSFNNSVHLLHSFFRPFPLHFFTFVRFF